MQQHIAGRQCHQSSRPQLLLVQLATTVLRDGPPSRLIPQHLPLLPRATAPAGVRHAPPVPRLVQRTAAAVAAAAALAARWREAGRRCPRPGRRSHRRRSAGPGPRLGALLPHRRDQRAQHGEPVPLRTGCWRCEAGSRPLLGLFKPKRLGLPSSLPGVAHQCGVLPGGARAPGFGSGRSAFGPSQRLAASRLKGARSSVVGNRTFISMSGTASLCRVAALGKASAPCSQARAPAALPRALCFRSAPMRVTHRRLTALRPPAASGSEEASGSGAAAADADDAEQQAIRAAAALAADTFLRVSRLLEGQGSGLLHCTASAAWSHGGPQKHGLPPSLPFAGRDHSGCGHGRSHQRAAGGDSGAAGALCSRQLGRMACASCRRPPAFRGPRFVGADSSACVESAVRWPCSTTSP